MCEFKFTDSDLSTARNFILANNRAAIFDNDYDYSLRNYDDLSEGVKDALEYLVYIGEID